MIGLAGEPCVSAALQTTRPRLALLRDLREEGWPSMDLCADMLAEQLGAAEADRLALLDVCPPMRRRV